MPGSCEAVRVVATEPVHKLWGLNPQHHNVKIGEHMRSKQIHIAMAQGNNRFEICQKVGKGVRAVHRSGTRLQDSIAQMLEQLGSEPVRTQSPTRLASGRPSAQ